VCTVPCHATLTYFELVGCKHSKLGRIVLELEFVRCERFHWFARVQNSAEFTWRHLTWTRLVSETLEPAACSRCLDRIVSNTRSRAESVPPTRGASLAGRRRPGPVQSECPCTSVYTTWRLDTCRHSANSCPAFLAAVTYARLVVENWTSPCQSATYGGQAHRRKLVKISGGGGLEARGS